MKTTILQPETVLIMRIFDRLGRLSVCFLMMAILPLFTLSAQESSEELTQYLSIVTEEIPAPQPPASPPETPANEIRPILQELTEEIPEKPKPKFVSNRKYSGKSFNIQLGYFKEKNNVTKMVNRIRSKYDWSVYVKTESKKGTDYFRVLIVDISNRKTADEIMGLLKAEGLKAVLKK